MQLYFIIAKFVRQICSGKAFKKNYNKQQKIIIVFLLHFSYFLLF